MGLSRGSCGYVRRLQPCVRGSSDALLPVSAAAEPSLGSVAPGRERERFVDPPAPRAQPGGPVITLPSTAAPAGAEGIELTISRIVVTGATVYSEADLAPLYADMLGGETTLAAVYDLARRITAKYGAAGYVLSRAVVPPQNLGQRGAVVRIQVVEGYVDQVVWPREKLARYRDFFTDYTARIVADRPANIRTLERYLLLANDLPGLKFTAALKPSATNPNASTLVVEVQEKMFDVNARVDNRGTTAQGPWQYLGALTVNNIAGAHEAFAGDLCGHLPGRGTAVHRGELSTGADQRRALRLCQCELRRRAPGHRCAARARLPQPQLAVQCRPRLSGNSLARDEPDGFRPRLRDQR